MTSSAFFANRARKLWRGARLVASGALVLLLLDGCEASQSPVDPGPQVSPSLQSEDLIGFSTEGVLMFLKPPDMTGPRSASKLINASTGGFVELNGFRVDIPAWALTRNTVITLDLPITLPEAEYIVADFGPDGTQFRKHVTITMPLSGANLAGTSPSDLTVSYWNGSAWEDIGGTVTSSSIRAATTHFSTYGARSRGGIDTTSGG